MAFIDTHPSRSAVAIEAAFRDSLRSRRMQHQFHYVSRRQSELWLELHQRYSPSRNDAAFSLLLEKIFHSAARRAGRGRGLRVVGLGCGGGRKDALLLKAFQEKGPDLSYVAADTAPALVEEALRHVVEVCGLESCRGLVADFMAARDLADFWRKDDPDRLNVFSFLGMMPNFEPRTALRVLGSWMGNEDMLLISANLAPGPDYTAGCECILPQYDNTPTRQWLLTVLKELGVDPDDLFLECAVVERDGVKRVEFNYMFPAACSVEYGGEAFQFHKGERFRLFYSNRFTEGQFRQLLEEEGFVPLEAVVMAGGEEGVWLVSRRT